MLDLVQIWHAVFLGESLFAGFIAVLVNAIIYNRAIMTNVKIIPNLTEMDLDQKLFLAGH